jgi:hypothetical protein
MKHLKAVFFVVASLLAYYSYAHADGHSGRDSHGGHSSDTTSHDSTRHSGDDGGGHHGSDDSTRVDNDSTEVRHGGDDSTEVRHDGDDSTEVRHGDDSTEVRHGGDDSTEVRHGGDSTEVRHGSDDSTEVRHGSDDSTKVRHGGDDSTNDNRHHGHMLDSVRVDDRGPGNASDNSRSREAHVRSRGNGVSDTARHHGEAHSEAERHAEAELHGLVIAGAAGGTVALGPPESATFQLFRMDGVMVDEWQGALDQVAIPAGHTGQFILVVSAPSVKEAVKLQLRR